jgi:hypothetical protein
MVESLVEMRAVQMAVQLAVDSVEMLAAQMAES